MTVSHGKQTILILDDDVRITEGLASALERPGRDVITCNDIESAELALDWMHPTHVVTDAHLSGQFGNEGLDLARLVRRQFPATAVILMTGDPSEALRREALARGAAAFFVKPFEASTLDAIIGATSKVSETGEGEGRIIRVPLLENLLLSCDLRTKLLPIVTLGDQRAPFAYQAVTSMQTGTPLDDDERLYQYARRKHSVPDLENLRIETVLHATAPLLRTSLLFMRVHSSLFADARSLSDFFIHNYAERELPVDHLILEVAEQEEFSIGGDVFESVERLHEIGIQFALADFGIGYANLLTSARLRPSFIKIHSELGTGLAGDLTKLRLVKNIVSLAHDLRCEAILEGVDSAASEEAARKLGVTLGQGSFFGAPLSPAVFEAGSHQEAPA